MARLKAFTAKNAKTARRNAERYGYCVRTFAFLRAIFAFFAVKAFLQVAFRMLHHSRNSPMNLNIFRWTISA